MTQVRSIDHPRVLIGIGFIDRIPEKDERGSRFNGTFHDFFHHLKGGDADSMETGILFTSKVMLRKGFIFLRIVEVFQSKAHDRIHFMRIKEGKIFAFDEALHEEVRNGNRGKDIMGLAPIIAVIGPQFNKFIKILVPNIKGHRRAALALTELVNGNSRIVIEPDPGNDPSGRVLESPDITVEGPNLSQIDA